MKVRLELTVVVDVPAWQDLYDTPTSEVRDDVRRYAVSAIRETAAGDAEAISDVILR